MTFLAGDTLDTARSTPNADDLERQERDGCYWWAGLNWWIRCDECSRTTPYHMPERIEDTADRLRWDAAWIAWEAYGGDTHRCADGCAQQLDLFGAAA